MEELKVLVERKRVVRKSDFAEFDVQIVKDEITIKMVQKKKEINCLLFVSKVIDQLQLELQHVAGEEHTFLFKAKVCDQFFNIYFISVIFATKHGYILHHANIYIAILLLQN